MERVRPRNGGRVPVAAAAAAEEPRAPRGIRETAALLRANGYGVLNQERLRGVPEQADAAAYEPQQQQQQQRHVRVVEPAGVRRLAQKRKAAEVSLSEDERPTRPTRGGAAAGLQEAPAAHAQAQSPQAGGMKRVRSAWKMRPLLVGGCTRCGYHNIAEDCSKQDMLGMARLACQAMRACEGMRTRKQPAAHSTVLRSAVPPRVAPHTRCR